MTGRLKIPMAWRAAVLGLLAVAMLAVPVQAANATSFSGEATVVDVDVNNPLGGDLLNLTLGEAGPLPPEGGSDSEEILNVNIVPPPLGLTASVIKARTQGSGSTAQSVAKVAGLRLTLANLVVTSTTLKSTATARCGDNGARVSGSSVIENLVVNGTSVTVTGRRNQVVELGPITLFINEQTRSVAADGSSGEITVTALRITVDNPLGGTLAEVVLSSAHADVICPANGGPDGGIGGPCADPAYYGIFDNTDSTVANVFRFQWYNGNGLNTVKKTVPAGLIFRTWEHWVKPFTTIRVAYKDPTTGNWVTLASEQSVKGVYPPCEYKRGFSST